jgi:hypothetical protein
MSENKSDEELQKTLKKLEKTINPKYIDWFIKNKIRVPPMQKVKIAEEAGVVPLTVSRGINKVQKALDEIDEHVKAGDLRIQPHTGQQQEPQYLMPFPQQHRQQIALPQSNPFPQLERFSEMAGIANAAGNVVGLGVATFRKGWEDETLPYQERMDLVMKGGSVVVGSIFSFYQTLKQFAPPPPPPPPLPQEVDDINAERDEELKREWIEFQRWKRERERNIRSFGVD